jgi:cardiolipin synthase
MMAKSSRACDSESFRSPSALSTNLCAVLSSRNTARCVLALNAVRTAPSSCVLATNAPDSTSTPRTFVDRALVGNAFNVPNTISFIRLALIPLFVWLVFVPEEYGWAGVLLGIIGATDWIDGYIARRYDQVTELGKFLDPLADRVAVVVAVISGLIVGVLPSWFAIALIVRELVIGVGALYGWRNGVTKLDVRWLGKAATLALYVSVAAFYIGVGFSVDAMVWLAYLFGVPGLFMYYWVAFQYLGDMRVAIAEAR